MILGQILFEIKKLNIYSSEEWEEYINYFDKSEELIKYVDSKFSKTISHQNLPTALLEKIIKGKSANLLNTDTDISPKIISADNFTNPNVRTKITLGIVSGCYDLLHISHIKSFVFAKQFLEQYPNPVLCALTLSDKNISAKKGEYRPILKLHDRLKMLCGVKCIDYVIPLEEPNCLDVLQRIKPDFFFKHKSDNTLQSIVRLEMDLVKSLGSSIIFFPSKHDKDVSTTRIIETVLMR
ncbi:MAG: hypothetical protein GY797_12170 [Deltaproteobacteria bacterium]|nr:hypothetical protein [Deltaproteobacteria bacterium]